MTRREEILARSRKIRRRKGFFKALLGMLVFSVLFAGVTWFFHLDFFTIKNVYVRGVETIDEKEIKYKTINNLGGLYFWLLPKDNVFLVSKDNISAKLLNSFARAKSIKVGRNLPDGLDVEVKERINTALSCKSEVCAYIDEDGFVFERAIAFDGKEFLKFFDEREDSFFAGSSISPRVGENILDKEEFEKLMRFAETFASEKFSVESVHIKENGSYFINTNEGWNIILNKQTDIASARENLVISLNGEIKDKRVNLNYIDLRFGNKIFYKFRE
ncbi:MAG: hypothetical protein COV02_01300 [Candidatus Terrybacteria bacterium CG10_big_fil_rev_8_21_14_0_10_41_10]|uniref:POTRA domain-containing protein n=1 Tax=Candidatus Terrybacteria bacterium CG10_big_fil_rev_8_21_14_0_10_41_10 TaxID=1975026 RepID=A0A2M8LAN2_9BACT|nr:MAG: hypothetical protein COV02_01300 [Candidatus Terrybacteria bacterium CG10_big_fil_rev_8_21_14_0_10_41_10]